MPPARGRTAAAGVGFTNLGCGARRVQERDQNGLPAACTQTDATQGAASSATRQVAQPCVAAPARARVSVDVRAHASSPPACAQRASRWVRSLANFSSDPLCWLQEQRAGRAAAAALLLGWLCGPSSTTSSAKRTLRRLRTEEEDSMEDTEQARWGALLATGLPGALLDAGEAQPLLLGLARALVQPLPASACCCHMPSRRARSSSMLTWGELMMLVVACKSRGERTGACARQRGAANYNNTNRTRTQHPHPKLTAATACCAPYLLNKASVAERSGRHRRGGACGRSRASRRVGWLAQGRERACMRGCDRK
jgi:hypothetical protein